MKPYFEAGLKELARVSGYPVRKFKRTLLEAWEPIYQVMMGKIATVKNALQKVDNNDYDATSSIADLQKIT